MTIDQIRIRTWRIRMDIRPAKDYKKPLYAIGLATAVMLSVTGCPSMPVNIPTEKSEVVSLAGETTVVEPLKEHTNTDIDISPYLVKNSGFYMNLKDKTDPDQLMRFAVSKLDKITEYNDLCCRGKYQKEDFLIIRTDKFSEWIRSDDKYEERLCDGVFCVRYQPSYASTYHYMIYHDPTGNFMVITDCADNKVISDFFTRGNASAAESSGSSENTEFTGNKEFPSKYGYFCAEEFSERIMDAKNALRWAKENHVVVFEDSKCTSGKDMWEAFIYNSGLNRDASVLLADYHSADKKKKTPATLDFYIISYEFHERTTYGDYYARARRSDSKKAGPFVSGYFKHFSGTDDIYVVTENDELTAKEAEELKMGPADGDYPEFFAIRFKKEAKKK